MLNAIDPKVPMSMQYLIRIDIPLLIILRPLDMDSRYALQSIKRRTMERIYLAAPTLVKPTLYLYQEYLTSLKWCT